MPSKIFLSYHKGTTKKTTQEQQQEGQYRRDVKQGSSLTQNNNFKDTGVIVSRNMVLFYHKRTTKRTIQE